MPYLVFAIGLFTGWLLSKWLQRKSDASKPQQQTGQDETIEREHTIIEAERLAVNAHRTKKNFLTHISHELKTPLNAIIGYSEMLTEIVAERGCEDLIPDLRKIQSGGENMLANINNIMEVSVIESGRAQIVMDTYTLPVIVDTLGKALNALAKKNGYNFEVQQQTDFQELTLDLIKVKLTLCNLLHICMRFASSGSSLGLRIQKVQDGNKTWVSFSLAGDKVNMPRFDEQVITHPDAEPELGLEDEGLGLGFVIAKYYTHLQGGLVLVGSQALDDSSFSIQLNTKSAQQRNILDEDWEIYWAKCLLVTDQPLLFEDLRLGMAQRGIDSEIVSIDALEKINEKDATTLIVLDTLIKPPHGSEVYCWIKHHMPESIMVLLTPNDQLGMTFELNTLGYMTKPMKEVRFQILLNRMFPDPKEAQLLVADDDPSNLEIIQRAIQKLGYNIDTASSGSNTIMKMHKNKPDLLILDLLMPGKDGFEVMEVMRNTPSLRHIPVIFLTSSDLAPQYRLHHREPNVTRIVLNNGYGDPLLLERILNKAARCRMRRAKSLLNMTKVY